jgi:hypothetical protein
MILNGVIPLVQGLFLMGQLMEIGLETGAEV